MAPQPPLSHSISTTTLGCSRTPHRLFLPPPRSPMFPSMEIFLRRFWKLESREPAGLRQCRLAGVDMVAPGGSTRGCRLLRSALSFPASRWA